MKSLLLLVLSTIPFLLFAQKNLKESTDSLENISLFESVSDTIPADISIFDGEQPLNMTLKYDITSFIRHKSKGEYMDAQLTIHYSESQTITKDIRVKARGNFRRGHCVFPPIHLNFKTDKILNEELEGAKKIKVVTHCSNAKSSEYNILREYLAYKLYNVLTDRSFRVRLLTMNYVDTGKKQRNYQNYAFLIEPIDLLAKRLESVTITPETVRGQNVIESEADRAALFQYMIANTDWRFKGGHNIKYIKEINYVSQKVIPIPYDFDFSGFVGTSYSQPPEWTSIDHVKQREYLGYCRDKEEDYYKTIQLFNDKKDEIIDVINNFAYLDQREKKELSDYTMEFFDKIERPERFLYTLKSQCRVDF